METLTASLMITLFMLDPTTDEVYFKFDSSMGPMSWKECETTSTINNKLLLTPAPNLNENGIPYVMFCEPYLGPIALVEPELIQ